MKKKHLIIMGIIILGAITILGLYQTFALSGDITKDTSGYYNVTVGDGTTVNVPANSSKTVYYKLTNTNKGVVQYGVGYSGTNITVKYYSDTQDPVTGTVDYGKSKFIKLYVENTGSTASTATLSTILGYEKGGDLIVPSGVLLITKMTYGYKGLAKLIAEDTFIPNSTVTNNNIDYEYDTTNSLMKDVGNNIRYYGASPNNYIYFNCSDYANQSSSTCETWRIIGVFDGKLKLIRNESIGNYSWDNKSKSTGAEYDYGKNDWTDARLMKLLNPGYESETVGGSLYYNSGNGKCYSGYKDATTTCSFVSTGITSNTTRGLILEGTWSLLGWGSGSIYADQIYKYESTTGNVYTGRPTKWTGKIALPYPSDYGYAADLSKCNQTLTKYNDSTCTSNNWMKTIMTSKNSWLLMPRSDDASYPSFISSSGTLGNTTSAYAGYSVVPVLYLNSELTIKSGTGSSLEPYQLDV